MHERYYEFTRDLSDVGAEGKERVGGTAGRQRTIQFGELLRKLNLLAPQCSQLKLNVARQRLDDWIPADSALNAEVRDVRRV